MTIEEKAKAYDEALERARALRQEAIDKEYAIDYVKDYEAIFPELAESEDERIRKALIKLMTVAGESYVMSATGFEKERLLAYLEKQKEQKPAEWSAKGRRGRIGSTPEHIRKKAENFLSKMEPPYDADDICSAYETGAMENANSSWSEEDEKMLRTIISDGSRGVELDSKQISWLKSLRPQPKKELSIEKAIQWLDDTFYFLDNSSGRGRDCEITTHDFDSLEEMYDSFRKAVTVDYRPSWRPSEEQMESLAYAIQVLNSNPHPKSAKAYQDLQTLYKNIKYGN